MCTVVVEHKNNKKKCRFFVVPRNGQVLLGMPDTDALHIINISIDSIGAKDARVSEWCANMQTVWSPNQSRKQLQSATQTWTAF